MEPITTGLMISAAAVSTYSAVRSMLAKKKQAEAEAAAQTQNAVEMRRRAELNAQALERRDRQSISQAEFQLSQSGGYGASFESVTENFNALIKNVQNARDMANYDYSVMLDNANKTLEYGQDVGKAAYIQGSATLLGGARDIYTFEKTYGKNNPPALKSTDSSNYTNMKIPSTDLKWTYDDNTDWRKSW